MCTIFNGLVEWDNFPHGNLMSNRTTTIMICQSMNDWKWQVIPPNLDPAFSAKSFSKTDEVRWALDHMIPLEKTVSCWYPTKRSDGKIVSCGECVACVERNYLFNKMGCPEKTLFKIKNIKGYDAHK